MSDHNVDRRTNGQLLASLPPIHVLPTNLPPDEMHEVEDLVSQHGGRLSYELNEARIFLAHLTQKKRAAFELRKQGVWTDECVLPDPTTRRKRKRDLDSVGPELGTSNTEVETEDTSRRRSGNEDVIPCTTLALLDQHVVVLKIDWLKQSIKTGQIVVCQPFLVYSARVIKRSKESDQTDVTRVQSSLTQVAARDIPTSDNLGNAATSQIFVDNTSTSRRPLPVIKYSPRRFRDQKYGRSELRPSRPSLYRTTTPEHDLLTTTRHSTPVSLPAPATWQLESHPRPNYACLRSTFANPPNSLFLSHLFKIKESRVLTLDEIGVRAYSTAIAALSAYPHVISSPIEVIRLPGCSDRIASLWLEWYNSCPEDAEARTLGETEALEKDEDLRALKLFYGIWGVGADTARKFYFEYGWKEIDDAVEFGWNDGSLNRAQQIGVKFYDDFKKKIAREEVERIADVVLRHARLCRDIPKDWWSNRRGGYRGNWSKPDDGRGDESWDPRDMVCIIVGGYRRGKRECGDVDVILSHRDEDVTRGLVVDVVASLESEDYITHTLTLHTTATARDQQTLPYRNKGHAGHGFDSLDKALCVWQDPTYDRSQTARNPNTRRRVDIIVSPWRTIGAAVLGWSGATTFERDIRRWCRKEKGWKFDSSGVRDRATGATLNFETPRAADLKGKRREGDLSGGVGDSWEDRERRLMEGLGIGWRPARERCTG